MRLRTAVTATTRVIAQIYSSYLHFTSYRGTQKFIKMILIKIMITGQVVTATTRVIAQIYSRYLHFTSYNKIVFIL